MWLVANEARTAKGGPYIYYYKPSSDLKLIALKEVSEFTSESWLRSARSAALSSYILATPVSLAA